MKSTTYSSINDKTEIHTFNNRLSTSLPKYHFTKINSQELALHSRFMPSFSILPSTRRTIGNQPDGTMCIRNLCAQCICNSHYLSQLAAFFIDSRAKKIARIGNVTCYKKNLSCWLIVVKNRQQVMDHGTVLIIRGERDFVWVSIYQYIAHR
ncbi:hypothetical protein DINM_005347 [Dirofilaria immitis]|nr:hypothetical protein [Dirofilaria immitis]